MLFLSCSQIKHFLACFSSRSRCVIIIKYCTNRSFRDCLQLLPNFKSLPLLLILFSFSFNFLNNRLLSIHKLFPNLNGIFPWPLASRSVHCNSQLIRIILTAIIIILHSCLIFFRKVVDNILPFIKRFLSGLVHLQFALQKIFISIERRFPRWMLTGFYFLFLHVYNQYGAKNKIL